MAGAEENQRLEASLLARLVCNKRLNRKKTQPYLLFSQMDSCLLPGSLLTLKNDAHCQQLRQCDSLSSDFCVCHRRLAPGDFTKL